MEIMRTQPCLVLTAFERAAPFLLAFILAAAGWAQDTSLVPPAPSPQNPVASSPQPFNVNEYAKPKSHFPNPINPYLVRQIEPPNLANTPRIDQFMHDGKLYISMNDAIALALENNLDIAIARYNLNIADTDVWRAQAGSSISGVNVGVVQNTPGGGTLGGSTGGSSGGGGGSGSRGGGGGGGWGGRGGGGGGRQGGGGWRHKRYQRRRRKPGGVWSRRNFDCNWWRRCRRRGPGFINFGQRSTGHQLRS